MKHMTDPKTVETGRSVSLDVRRIIATNENIISGALYYDGPCCRA